MEPPMDVEQALQVVAQVCAGFQGNLQQHQQIQTALDVVVAAAREPVAEAVEPTVDVPAENGNRAPITIDK